MKKILKKIFGVIPYINRFLMADEHYMSSLKLSETLRFGEALKEINRAIELRPRASHYVYQRGLIHFARKNYRLAQTDFLRAWPDYFDHPEVMLNIAFCFKELGECRYALRLLRSAISMNRFSRKSDEKICRMGIIDCLALLGNLKQAFAECDSALAIFPDDINILVMKLNLCIAQKKFEELLELSKKISNLCQENQELARLVCRLEEIIYFPATPAGHA